MELRFRGEYVLASPDKPIAYSAEGPGMLVGYVVPAAQTDRSTAASVNLEVTSGSKVLLKQAITSQVNDGIRVLPQGTRFRPTRVQRVAVELLEDAVDYQVKVDGNAAIAAFRRPRKPRFGQTPESPLKPSKPGQKIEFEADKTWYWVSVCDPVRVSVPSMGMLQVIARTQITSLRETPAPSFVRVLEGGKVKAADPVTAAPEPGLEFAVGRSTFMVGEAKTTSVWAAEATMFEVELAAWGCVNGVGVQLEFTPNQGPPPAQGELISSQQRPEPPDGSASSGATQAPACSNDAVQQESRIRTLAMEYVDTLVASGVIPPSRFSLRVDNSGTDFEVTKLTAKFDGADLLSRDEPRIREPLLHRKILPGPHRIEVQLTLRFRGAGADYTLRLNKNAPLVTDAGKRYRLNVVVVDKGAALPLKERADARVELLPDA